MHVQWCVVPLMFKDLVAIFLLHHLKCTYLAFENEDIIII